jgi:hypothetical protein
MIGWSHVITLCPEGVDRFFGFVLFEQLFDFLALKECWRLKKFPSCRPAAKGWPVERTDTTI